MTLSNENIYFQACRTWPIRKQYIYHIVWKGRYKPSVLNFTTFCKKILDLSTIYDVELTKKNILYTVNEGSIFGSISGNWL